MKIKTAKVRDLSLPKDAAEHLLRPEQKARVGWIFGCKGGG